MREPLVSKSLGVELLGALGISASGVVGATLELKPRGELSVLTVRYAVYRPDQISALAEVVKRWSVVPEVEPARANGDTPDALQASQGAEQGVANA